MRTEVPYPDRPGRHRISLADDRAEAVEAELRKAVTGPIDALPPGVASRLADLLRDLHRLRLCELEDPNGLHLRARDMTREVEQALVTPAAGMGDSKGRSRLRKSLSSYLNFCPHPTSLRE